MSTYYYMVCNKHKERTPAASITLGGIGCHLSDSDHTLQPFIVSHAECPVRIVSEYEEDAYDDKFIEWNKNNVRELANKDR